MDKLIYMSVHLVCLVYILYKVWGWKSKVYEICILLYEKKSEKNFVNEKIHRKRKWNVVYLWRK